MNAEIKRLKRELQCEGAITKYYKDTVQLPDGKTEIYDFVGHNGAAAAVGVLEDGRLLMVRQYRNALDRFTLEIPAGGLNPQTMTLHSTRILLDRICLTLTMRKRKNTYRMSLSRPLAQTA